MRQTLLTLGVALALIMTTGCSQTPGGDAASIPPPVVDEPSEAALADAAARDQAATLESLLTQFPDATVPNVEWERFIELEEFGPVMAACYTDQGFPSVASADGGVSGEYQEEEAEAYALAGYTCMTKFPTNPKYSIPLNESQIAYIYDYQTQVLTPCLEDAGYTVDAPPAREDFVASYLTDGGGWYPYEHVNAGSLTVSLNLQCPQLPEHLNG